jgi:hypothetical protein
MYLYICILYYAMLQVLAIRRGQKEGILGLSFSTTDRALDALRRFIGNKYHVSTNATSSSNSNNNSGGSSIAGLDVLGLAVEEALSRILSPVRQRAAWRSAVQTAEVRSASDSRTY